MPLLKGYKVINFYLYEHTTSLLAPSLREVEINNPPLITIPLLKISIHHTHMLRYLQTRFQAIA